MFSKTFEEIHMNEIKSGNKFNLRPVKSLRKLIGLQFDLEYVYGS